MPELFGVRIASPREIYDGATATAQALGDGASRLGSSALARAGELGRTIDTTVRDVGAHVDRAIGDAQTAAQTGLRDGVTWTGQRIHDGANAARSAVGDDTVLGRAASSVITGAETRARFSVGVVGGVATEAVGLVGTAATLGSTALQVQLSPTRREEVTTAIAGAVTTGLDTAVRYGQSVAADPGRLITDGRAVGQGAMDLGGRVVNHYQTAIDEGRGPEAFGMTAGQVLANVVPIGAGANAARLGVTGAVRLTAREGAEVVAREGAETVAREGGETAARRAGESVARREGGDSVGDASRAGDGPAPIPRPAIDLPDRAAYRAATKDPQPNTTYRYDGYTFQTDGLGRGVESSGTLSLGNGGNRFYDDRLIGYPHNPDALPGDIGFHAGADQFGFPGGTLNVFPGNTQLNSGSGAYGRFENTVLRPLVEDGRTVDAQFSRIFYEGNATGRPDEMQVIYRVDGGPPRTTTFLNRAGD